MKSVHLTALMLSVGMVVASSAATAATITPTNEERRIDVSMSCLDYSGYYYDSDSRTATPGDPFSDNIYRAVSGALSSANAYAEQSSSMSSTAVTGSGEGTCVAYGFDEFAQAAAHGRSICDVTFTIDGETGYHFSGFTAANSSFENSSSAVILYSGANEIQRYDAGPLGPGGSFDVAGILPAGSYRIRGEAIAPGSIAGGISGDDLGYAEFSFNFNLLDVSAVSDAPVSASKIELLQNRPNPFRTFTTIPVLLPESARVKLGVFDLSGRLVANLADREFSAGAHEFTWEAAGLPAGVYFSRLEVNGVSRTKRLVVKQ